VGKNTVGHYNSIKELVIETCMSEGEFPSYDKLTSIVLENFPKSKWQKTHYAWYKSKIKCGAINVVGLDQEAFTISDNKNDIEDDVIETIDATISLERDLHSYLASRVDEIEHGLVLADGGVEYQTEAGRIDILAIDGHGKRVVVELKAGRAKDNALGQLLGYMGCLGADTINQVQEVRGILVASDFEPRVVFAAKALPMIKLLRYRVSFELQEVR
jgi:hypothetical protein